MVLEVLAHAGQRVDDRDADAAQMGGVADPAELQHMQRTDGTAGEDHLTPCLDPLDGPAAA